MEEIKIEESEGKNTSKISLQERLTKYASDREARIHQFLSHVNSKRDQFIEDLCVGMNTISIAS